MKSRSLIILILIAMFAVAMPSFAQSEGNSLNPTEDVWVYRLEPDSNYDSGSSNPGSGLLILSHDGGIGADGEQANRYVFLKFDLSEVNTNITDVSLFMSSIVDDCVGEGSAAVALELFGVDNDSWSESTLTWNISESTLMPAATSTLATLVDGVLTSVGYNELTGGDLATFLETQRTGDGIATVGLRIADGYPNQDAFFEDQEGTGTSANCGAIDGAPELMLPLAPTSVALSGSDTISASLDKILLPVVLLIAGLLSLLIFRQNKRRKAVAYAQHQRQHQQQSQRHNNY